MLRLNFLLALPFLASAIVVSQGCDVSGLRRDGFTKHGGEYVWYNSSFVMGDSVRPLGVDTASFIIFEREGYAKDSKKVFWQWNEVANADASTFFPIEHRVGYFGNCYASDRTNVYLKGLRIPGADPATFQIMDAPYTHDSKSVFCGTVRIPEADPESFEILRTSTRWKGAYQNDEFVKRNGDQFIGIEMPVITSGGQWARDANHHYRDAARVQDADYDSYHAVDDHWGQDKNGRFRGPFREEVFLKRVSVRPAFKANNG